MGSDINSLQTSGHPHNNLFITLNQINQAKVLMKTTAAASRYVFKFLITERPHTLCVHMYQLMFVCVLALITTVMPGLPNHT